MKDHWASNNLKQWQESTRQHNLAELTIRDLICVFTVFGGSLVESLWFFFRKKYTNTILELQNLTWKSTKPYLVRCYKFRINKWARTLTLLKCMPYRRLWCPLYWGKLCWRAVCGRKAKCRPNRDPRPDQSDCRTLLDMINLQFMYRGVPISAFKFSTGCAKRQHKSEISEIKATKHKLDLQKLR